ncbi:hypothetical protein K458DRAFT_423714 [Lentithecium fluviatile CBS 122367]|uniref:Uncharacterized protein n=1 Tax=Lentithecium fluviatile CBS 122367 TaxID=1168545 RepID=A0A6G1IHD9_9PLEO|nr:hypothetical protein K458DRAFT_423714 [Lentithecium fluviatile CBS 122367]
MSTPESSATMGATLYPPHGTETTTHRVPSTASITDEIAKTVAHQPASQLLQLPMEIRLIIYKDITISPMSLNGSNWLGVYLTCRQLNLELRDALKPENDVENITGITCNGRGHNPRIVISNPAYERFGLIQEVTISMPIPGRFFCCGEALERLYKLWLRHLRVVLTGEDDGGSMMVYDDLKSFHPSIFIYFAEQGQVNCKAVTFTLESLADAEEGRSLSTSLENTLRNGVPYTLKIVQDKDGQQSERTYSSASRFKEVDSGRNETEATWGA